MKKLTITLDSDNGNWNTDRWHRSLQEVGAREQFKIALDAATTIFHNLLHDIPCSATAAMTGLEPILGEGEKSQRSEIKKEIADCDQMKANFMLLQGGIWIDIEFYSGKRKKRSMSVQYDVRSKTFFCML